ncbi:MAG: DinB family protein [Terriglobia bacterium]
MNHKLASIFALAVAGALAVQAQAPAGPPSVATAAKATYTRIKTNFQKAAEKMPEENYSFKPVAEVESFGERVAHISRPQLATCSALTGERKTAAPNPKATKAELVAALSESFAACDKAFDALTDANALEAVSAGRGQQTRITQLYGVIVHANEVYGAMGVYMRLKGIVPPSSEPR